MNKPAVFSPFKSLLPSELLSLIPKSNYKLGEGGYCGLGPPSSGGIKAKVVHAKGLHTPAVSVSFQQDRSLPGVYPRQADLLCLIKPAQSTPLLSCIITSSLT